MGVVCSCCCRDKQNARREFTSLQRLANKNQGELKEIKKTLALVKGTNTDQNRGQVAIDQKLKNLEKRINDHRNETTSQLEEFQKKADEVLEENNNLEKICGDVDSVVKNLQQSSENGLALLNERVDKIHGNKSPETKIQTERKDRETEMENVRADLKHSRENQRKLNAETGEKIKELGSEYDELHDKITSLNQDMVGINAKLERFNKRNAKNRTFNTARDDAYELGQNPGDCLIINNLKFTNSNDIREGSVKDEWWLEYLFKKFGFHITIERDLKLEDMRTSLQRFSEGIKAYHGASVVFILSHGDSGTVVGTDNGELQIAEVWQPFLNNGNLNSKPKLFFFQACQGANEMGTENVDATPQENFPKLPPMHQDIFVGCATINGYKAYRDIKEGTPFIRKLVEVLKSRYKTDHLVEMMADIVHRVGEQEEVSVQVPYHASTLSKKMFFKKCG